MRRNQARTHLALNFIGFSGEGVPLALMPFDTNFELLTNRSCLMLSLQLRRYEKYDVSKSYVQYFAKAN